MARSATATRIATCRKCDAPRTTEGRYADGRLVPWCDACWAAIQARPTHVGPLRRAACPMCGRGIDDDDRAVDSHGWSTGLHRQCQRDYWALHQRLSRARRGMPQPTGPVRRPIAYDAICLDCACTRYEGQTVGKCGRCGCDEGQHVALT